MGFTSGNKSLTHNAPSQLERATGISVTEWGDWNDRIHSYSLSARGVKHLEYASSIYSRIILFLSPLCTLPANAAALMNPHHTFILTFCLFCVSVAVQFSESCLLFLFFFVYSINFLCFAGFSSIESFCLRLPFLIVTFVIFIRFYRILFAFFL